MRFSLKNQLAKRRSCSFCFKKLLKGHSLTTLEEEKISKLVIFANVYKYPSRIKCAILAWHAVMAALTNEKSVSSENVEI